MVPFCFTKKSVSIPECNVLRLWNNIQSETPTDRSHDNITFMLKFSFYPTLHEQLSSYPNTSFRAYRLYRLDASCQ